MIWIKAKRVIKAGFVNFWRNGWISLATVLVMVITLFAIGSLIFSRAILGSMISQIQDKVDISIYFKTDVEESDILALKDSVSKLPEVKSAEYVSAEQSLENFKERHEDNALIMQSIEELGENPLGAMLNIKTKETSQYDSVAKYLESQSDTAAGSMIDKINYYQNKKVIDRLSKILDSAKTLGTAISVILVIISIIIAFNTIRLAIYISREEIGVMRLVGASDRFVRGPFIVEGVIYGAISSIIAMIIFYPLTLWLGPMTDNFFSGINIFQYYVANFGQIFLILLLLGVSVGAFSSYIAVKRYLKV
jgi:cell division transport system permease protein